MEMYSFGRTRTRGALLLSLMCDRMRDVGGEVGPALDRDGSLASLFTTAQLRDYVRHDGSRFPQLKLAQFSKLLSPAEIDQIVAYLEVMQPAHQ